LTASRDRFFNPCNPKSRHCYNPLTFKVAGLLHYHFEVKKMLQPAFNSDI
jgi:hypothetical protein